MGEISRRILFQIRGKKLGGVGAATLKFRMSSCANSFQGKVDWPSIKIMGHNVQTQIRLPGWLRYHLMPHTQRHTVFNSSVLVANPCISFFPVEPNIVIVFLGIICERSEAEHRDVSLLPLTIFPLGNCLCSSGILWRLKRIQVRILISMHNFVARAISQ